MASRSSSRSEGEVLSSDSEAKANKSLSSRNDSKVDRHTRPYPAPRSPKSRPYRSSSRSPYRAPHGEKRRRDEDHVRDQSRNDTRKFNVRYEDDRHSNRRNLLYDHRDTKRSRTYSRSRSRSRSPYRHSRAGGFDTYSDRGLIRDHDEKQGKTKDDKFENNSPVGRDKQTASENMAGNRAGRPHGQKTRRLEKNSSQTSSDKYTSFKKLAENAQEPVELAEDTSEDAQAAGTAFLDETALIEERRKRREAIKNKYRGQATPLHLQALHLRGESNQSTPGPASTRTSPARSVSPAASTPRTPQDSGPQSPADVSFARDEELANRNTGSPAEDEPSAADYDPAVDMEEERARHDKRLFKEDDKSLADAEKQVINNVTKDSKEKSPEKAEFDMFAEEDDDMFAEAPLRPKPEIKTAQALDVTMMDNWDDQDGYYITILGELIENRYHVTQNLGRGMFSSVVRAEDSTENKSVAIKIVRNNETMRKAGIKEIDILKDISMNDPDDKKHVIRLLRSFDHKGHLCMVFENLSLNLREVLKKFGRDVGINLKAIRAYAQQLFLGLGLLKKCQYLHADLKPDNILVNEGRNLLKICDLGSASPITENATAPYLVSRFYRAPEIILGIPYDYGIDMWSIGCTLFELYTGKILFTGRNNNNMLRAIMECRGKFPHKLLRRGTLAYEYFDDLLNFRSMETDKVTGRVVTKMIDIKAKPVKDLRSRLIPKGKRLDEQERKDVELFADLLDKCLDLRPDKRITPSEALKHPFIMRMKS